MMREKTAPPAPPPPETVPPDAPPPPETVPPDAPTLLTPEEQRVFAAAPAAAFAAMAFMAPPGTEHHWEKLGVANDDESIGRSMAALAGFVRAHPAAPAEALYRFASAQGVHDDDPDGWATQPIWARVAYGVFGAVLTLLDAMAVQAAAEAARPAPDAPAPLAAALALPEDDTTLARRPDPLAMRPGMVLRRTPSPDDGA